jgi:hypothetical protein
MRDPFLLRLSNGGVLLFGTTDENVWGGPAVGFDYYRSADLEHFEGPFPAFRPAKDFWADTQFWAPEVHQWQGRFFMLATFCSTKETPKVRGTAILVSDSPQGPYLPWSDGPVTPKNLPCLDGTLFIDQQGNPWIVYSRGAEGIPGIAPGIQDGEMYARKLVQDLSAAEGDPVLLFKSSDANWSRPLILPPSSPMKLQLGLADDPLFTDGAFIVETASGVLHMLWSAMGESGYAMGYATSISGDVLGPWKQADIPLWPADGGHGMILRKNQETGWLVFHTPNDTPNERVKLVEVQITDDGIRLLD